MAKKGTHLSEEHKRKISEARKGKQWSEEAKQKMSESRKGENHPMFGKHHSDETKRKIGAASKGNKYSLGRVYSEETLLKISESCKKYKPTEETKKKISESHKGKPLSKEHRRRIREANKGEKSSFFGKRGELSYAWKGGISPANVLIRSGSESKNWKISVYERDNYTCQKCGQIGYKLNAHHIKSFSKHPELRFDVDNGITYCENCHKNGGFHKKELAV